MSQGAGDAVIGDSTRNALIAEFLIAAARSAKDPNRDELRRTAYRAGLAWTLHGAAQTAPDSAADGNTWRIIYQTGPMRWEEAWRGESFAAGRHAFLEVAAMTGNVSASHRPTALELTGDPAGQRVALRATFADHTWGTHV